MNSDRDKDLCARWSDEVLLQYHLFELDAAAREACNGHLLNCWECWGRLKAIAKSLAISETDASGKTYDRCPAFTVENVQQAMAGTLASEIKGKWNDHMSYCFPCSRLYRRAKYQKYNYCGLCSDDALRDYCTALEQYGTTEAGMEERHEGLAYHLAHCESCNARWKAMEQSTDSATVAATLASVARASDLEEPADTCGKVSADQIERYFAGQLSELESTTMIDHCRGCQSCTIAFNNRALIDYWIDKGLIAEESIIPATAADINSLDQYAVAEFFNNLDLESLLNLEQRIAGLADDQLVDLQTNNISTLPPVSVGEVKRLIAERRSQIEQQAHRRGWRVIKPGENIRCFQSQADLDRFKSSTLSDNQIEQLAARIKEHAPTCDHCKDKWAAALDKMMADLRARFGDSLDEPCLQWHSENARLIIGGLLSKPVADAIDRHVEQCSDCLARYVAEIEKNPCTAWHEFMRPAFFTKELSFDDSQATGQHLAECFSCSVLWLDLQLKSGRVIIDRNGEPVSNPNDPTLRATSKECEQITDQQLMWYRHDGSNLSKETRDQIVAHLDRCAACCARLVDIDDDVKSAASDPANRAPYQSIFLDCSVSQTTEPAIESTTEPVNEPATTATGPEWKPAPPWCADLGQNSRGFDKRLAMAAAVLVCLGLTGALVYWLSAIPRDTARLTSPLSRDVDSDFTASAELFEQADTRIKAHPQDVDAHIQRTAMAERFGLLNVALSDYQEYLASGRDRAAEVRDRLASLQAKMSAPMTAPFSRYEQIDNAIDSYLTARKQANMAEAFNLLRDAEKIAREMITTTGDQIGQDQIAYYRGLPSAAIEQIIAARRLRGSVQAAVISDNFLESLRSLHRAKLLFQQFGADLDVQQTDIEIARYLDKIELVNAAEHLMSTNINRADSARHHYLKAQSLYMRAMALSDKSDFTGATDDLNAAIKIAQGLDVPRFLMHPALILTGIYHAANDDSKAFQWGNKAMAMAYSDRNSGTVIQLCQLLGLSAFKLSYPGLAETYLNQSIALAEKHNNPIYLTLSRAFLGIVKAEQSNGIEAEANFRLSFAALDKLTDTGARRRVMLTVTGYHGRAQMLAGKPTEAINSYREAITIGQQVNIQDRLVASQLHQGLGECLDATGKKAEAETEMLIATDLDREGREKAAQNNSLLSFAVTRRNCYEQLRLIRESRDR